MGEETNPKGELPGMWAGSIGKQVCRAEACQGVGRVICELRAGRPSNAALKRRGGGGGGFCKVDLVFQAARLRREICQG